MVQVRIIWFVDLQTIDCQTNRSLYCNSLTHQFLSHTLVFSLWNHALYELRNHFGSAIFADIHAVERVFCDRDDPRVVYILGYIQCTLYVTRLFCQCSIQHAFFSLWDRWSFTSSTTDNQHHIRYGLLGTSTHEPLTVNDPIHTTYFIKCFGSSTIPFFLWCPIFTHLCPSLCTLVHIITTDDCFHVYIMMRTMDQEPTYTGVDECDVGIYVD